MGRLTIPIPEAALNGRGIQALAIAVKPTVAREQPFAARIVLTLKDESVRYLTGAMRLKPAGALLLIDASPCPGEPDRGGGTANGCARGSGAEGAFRDARQPLFGSASEREWRHGGSQKPRRAFPQPWDCSRLRQPTHMTVHSLLH